MFFNNNIKKAVRKHNEQPLNSLFFSLMPTTQTSLHHLLRKRPYLLLPTTLMQRIIPCQF